MLPIKMQAARRSLISDYPYLATAVLAMQPVARPRLGTMAVDRWWRVYYDPEIAEKWTVKQIAGVFYHEVEHLLRDHAGRLEQFEREMANLAADMEINDDLKREGINLPGTPVLPSILNFPEGLFAEEYYYMLRGNNQILQENPIFHKNSPMPGAGRCGSCATGIAEPWEEGPPEANNVPGISNTEAELIRRRVAMEVLEHARNTGNIPSHLRRWAEAKLRSGVDWRRELTSAVRRTVSDVAGMCDYSYKRPNRRQSQFGGGKIIFPALRQPLPCVAVVVDTSASIYDEMLSQALAEIQKILQSTQARIHVLAVDAEVQKAKSIGNIKQVELRGGGGTDMRKGIEAATRLTPRPEVCIVLTDGYTPWPEKPPAGMKVIIGLLDIGLANRVPEWARVVKITEEKPVNRLCI